MAISSTPSQVATSALQAIPFSSMIGGPLKACIDAQAMAAKTTWDFIQEVGLTIDPETGEKKAVNVSFSFIQNGRTVQLNVPLLTIVPIPYIAINTIDINFKASISASSSSVSETNSSSSTDVDGELKAGLKVGPFHMDAKINANYSSKKDSKATEESKYSVEYTMDIAVKAGQDSMPAGLAKVLELLGNSLDVSDPNGTLNINTNRLTQGEHLIATYKNKDGLYEPSAISVVDKQMDLQKDGDSVVIDLTGVDTGIYTLKAGKQEVKFEVVAKQPAAKTENKQ